MNNLVVNPFQNLSFIKSVPASWGIKHFKEVFRDASGGNKKIKKQDFAEVGSLAVVDQGKSLVAGFTDDLDFRCETDGKAIVFGDHTRALKYIDFPFAMGADGTKVLQTKRQDDYKYLYYFLLSVQLPSDGYSRHFKHLKKVLFPLPPLEEQRRIVEILDAAQALIDQRKEQLVLMDQLVQSLFYEMFGDPVTNPMGWEIAMLNKHIDLERGISYGVVQRGPSQREGVPVIRIRDVIAASFLVENIVRTTDEISEKYKRTILRGGELLMSIRGTVGRLAAAPPHAAGWNISREVAIIPLLDGLCSSYFLHLLRDPAIQRGILSDVKGVAQSGVNLKDLRKMIIPNPPMELQTQFAERVKAIEVQKAAMAASLVELETTFQALMQRAFKGELTG